MRQNSDYHRSSGELLFYVAGWSYDRFEGPVISNVSQAGIFAVNLCDYFDPQYNKPNHLVRLGSPAAGLESQICCLYTYKC